MAGMRHAQATVLTLLLTVQVCVAALSLYQSLVTLAGYLNEAKRKATFLRDDQLRPLLSQAQAVVQRGLKEAYLVDGTGKLMTRGERSYLFDFEPLTPQQLRLASEGNTVLIPDWKNNEFRALIRLEAYADRYLYVTRTVDGSILSLLDITLSMSARTLYDPPRSIMTIDLSTQFIGTCTGLLKAEGRVIRAGQTTIFCEGEARSGTGELVAKAIGTFRARSAK